MPIGPTDPINTNDIDEIRVGVLGRTVDDSNPHWTTGGAAAARNALNTRSGEKIVNRAINALDSEMVAVSDGISGFANRFNSIVGDEGGPDQPAFNDIGKNLIQAVHDLKNETPSLAQQGMWNMGIASAATHQQDPNPHVTASQKTDWTNRITALENAAGGGVTLAGDVTGSAASTVVTAIHGRSIVNAAPVIGTMLYWAAAVPGTPSQSPQPERWAYIQGPPVGACGTLIMAWDSASTTINPSHTPLWWQQPEYALKFSRDVSLRVSADGKSTAATVRGIHGVDIASKTPVPGDVLGFVGASWTPIKNLLLGFLADDLAANQSAYKTLVWTGYNVNRWAPVSFGLRLQRDVVVEGEGYMSSSAASATIGASVTVHAIQNSSVSAERPTHGEVLTWVGGSGRESWGSSRDGSWTPMPLEAGGVTLAGDVIGNHDSTTVTRIRGIDVSTNAPGHANVLAAYPKSESDPYGPKMWVPKRFAMSWIGDVAAKTAPDFSHNSETAPLYASVTVTGIQAYRVATVQPTHGQVLTWLGGSPGGSWTPWAAAGGGVTFQAIVDALPAGQFSSDSLRWRLATPGTASITAQPAGWEIGRVMPVGNQHGDLLMWNVPGITTNTPSPVGEGYWTNVLMRPDATPSSTTPADGSMLVWRNLASPSFTMPDRGWPGRFVLASQTVDTTYRNVLINEGGLKGAASVTPENPGRLGNVVLGFYAMNRTPGVIEDIGINDSVFIGYNTYLTPQTKDASRAVFNRNVVIGPHHHFDLTGRNEANIVIGTGSTSMMSYWRTKDGSYNTIIGVGNRLDCGSTGIGDTGPDHNIIIASYSSLHADRTGVIESGLMPVARDNILIGRDLRLFTDGTVLMASSVTVRNILIGSASATNRMSHSSPEGRILLRGSDCIGIGWRLENYYLSGSTAPTNMITIGSGAKWYGNNTAHIGNSQLATISYGAATGTAFTNRSDARLKENIHDADVDRCLADIDRLKVKRFNYKPCVESDRDHTVTGFLAQDFGNVFPKAMFKNEFNNKGVRINDCLSTDTSQLVPTLVAAVQALSAQVRAMTRHNASETLQ